MDLGVDLDAGDEPQSNSGQGRLSTIETSVLPGSAHTDPIYPHSGENRRQSLSYIYDKRLGNYAYVNGLRATA